jgi:hypothetical protein
MVKAAALVLALSLAGGADAFLGPAMRSKVQTVARMSTDPSKADLGFKPWEPKDQGGTDKYGSTDTPDFFEDDSVQGGKGAGDIDGTQQGGGTPLSELMQTDSWTIGGREALEARPSWFSATPMSVPDATLKYDKSGQTLYVTVENGAMGYEDFYADFADGTSGGWEVEPVTGESVDAMMSRRMD